MKLLMITGLGSARDLVSGKKGAFYHTLEEFSKHWERIDIICPRITNYDRDSRLRTGTLSDQLRITNLFGNVYLHISPWPLICHPLWFLKKGLEIYKKEKFDLMTVQEFAPFYNGIGARIIWQFIKVPYILELHHITGYPRAGNFKEKLYKNLTRLFIKWDASRAMAVRTVNREQVPDFLIASGVPKEKILYIPSIYLDLGVFKPMNFPKEYDLIFIGRLEKNKGLNLFLDAIKKLNCNAIIIGDGSLGDSVKLEIENWKLKINFHGWAKDQKEIAELLNKSKILVMASYNEGGPRVVPEAMACGVPVLATAVGIVPDLLKNGHSGEIIAWKAEDIAQKAYRLLNDVERYKEYSRSGQEAVKQFEKRAAIKNYAEKLKGLI